MRRFLSLSLLAVLLLTAFKCEKIEDVPEPELEVTANNIAGTWVLAEWNGGTPAEGTYVYLEFTRRDQLFTMYDNIGSFSARRRTGRFNITIDEKLGSAVIRGQYDYGAGDWQHRYVVTGLTGKSMTWTAVDDPADVSVYHRCDGIPQEILDEI